MMTAEVGTGSTTMVYVAVAEQPFNPATVT